MRRIIIVLISLVAMAGSVPTQAHTGYSVSSLRGRWGFFEEFRVGDKYGTSVGIVRFDGAGGCKVEQVTNGGTKAEAVEQETDCTYTLRRGGRGTITGAPTAPYSFSIAEHGKAIVFIHDQAGVVGHGEMRPTGPGRLGPQSIAGRWSFIHPAELGGVYETSTGTYRFDGLGECFGKFRVNGGAVHRPRDESFRCTYDVERDGRGQTSVDHLVVVDSGTRIYLIHGAAFNVGWAELTRL
ncbi:MAG TPA: hypothetical protein VG929_01625 [Actinomycetota bacterium]|nr:hypothetical protein [Actinomycetota bacterium]